MEPALYKPLPDDWTIGIADIVQSTKAIRENRYRSVNMAGAAVIAALKNSLDGSDFPYVFGGDGASFAVPRAPAVGTSPIHMNSFTPMQISGTPQSFLNFG